MLREYTCIMCPKGCDMTAELDDKGTLLSVSGHTCKKGEEYVIQELTDPRRNIATSVLIEGGEIPLVSVRLTSAIPKDRIFDAMEVIKKVKVKAPVEVGQVIIQNILELDSDVVITKKVGIV